jgi:uncharacterized protein (TIGR02444 family)
VTAGRSDPWDFVQAFYRRPGVAAACLTLQDRHGADVTLMLFLLARAEGGQTFGPDDIARLKAAIQPWLAATVAPLRALRSQLKSPLGDVPAATLRQMIATAEIEAERLQLIQLESLIAVASSPCPSVEAAQASLHAYAGAAGFPAEALQPLLAVFETIPADWPIDKRHNEPPKL